MPSQLVISQMLLRTLPWALRKAGFRVTQEQFDALEKLIWVTGEKDGQSHVELL